MKKTNLIQKLKNKFRYKNKSKKSQIWMSAVIYLLITIVVMSVVLAAGLPLIREVRDKTVVNSAKNNMAILDNYILQVASEGPGSQRVVSIEIPKGDFYVGDGSLRWSMLTDFELVNDNSVIDLGQNLKLTSTEQILSYEEGSFYVMENQFIKVRFNKIGSPTNLATISTDRIIQDIQFEDGTAQQYNFNFSVSGVSSGEGYTKLQTHGENLGSSELIAHIESDTLIYDIIFTLEGNADYLKINTKIYD